ncbi:MAG TPA: GNAT family N-acetyltransferase [Solirubrobacteraceae bacterium]|nr:GNAT family N-acetyltransferase [Solirubrobacteraceae bacterium]
MLRVRELESGESGWAGDVYAGHWDSPLVARRGEIVDLRTLPAFVAELDGERAGIATYAVREDGCELASVIALVEGVGVARALVGAVKGMAARAGCARVWLVTTNDNTRALRAYQRHGFDLAALRHGAVDDARRTLKPEIPETGRDGIPLRHELELELPL